MGLQTTGFVLPGSDDSPSLEEVVDGLRTTRPGFATELDTLAERYDTHGTLLGVEVGHRERLLDHNPDCKQELLRPGDAQLLLVFEEALVFLDFPSLREIRVRQLIRPERIAECLSDPVG